MSVGIRMAGAASGETPAIVAIYWRSAESLELLLARGARLDVFEAAAAGRLERVRELLGAATKRGARP